MATETTQQVRTDRSPSTLINALLGAVVTVVLAFTTVSPVLGGAVTGYLERGTYARGAMAGAISGFFAALLGFVVFFFVPIFAGFGLRMGGMRGFEGTAVWTAWTFWVVIAFAFFFVIALAAVGGLVGTYIAEYRFQND